MKAPYMENRIAVIEADWEELAMSNVPDIGFVCNACGQEKCFDLVDDGEPTPTKVINCTHLLFVDGQYRPLCNDCFATFLPPRSTASKLFGT